MEGKPLELTKLLKVMERLQFINETLAHRPFIACSHETVADHAYLSIIADMITMGEYYITPDFFDLTVPANEHQNITVKVTL